MIPSSIINVFHVIEIYMRLVYLTLYGKKNTNPSNSNFSHFQAIYAICTCIVKLFLRYNFNVYHLRVLRKTSLLPSLYFHPSSFFCKYCGGTICYKPSYQMAQSRFQVKKKKILSGYLADSTFLCEPLEQNSRTSSSKLPPN